MRLGIIGCGTIAATYIRALARLEGLFEVTALYDVLPEKARALALPGAVVCSSLEELAGCREVDCVVVSTPLHTHTRIAELCLKRGKHVLMEKPAALSPEEIRGLFDLAEEVGRVFHVAFHSSFGVDIDWYLEGPGRSDPVFCLSRIRRIACGFYDPYMPDGTIQEDRKLLGGSYIDSGVNILSVSSRLTPLEALTLRSHEALRTAEGVVYASKTLCAGNGVELVMETGWNLGLNQKRTRLAFHGTDDALLLDHTGQSVWRLLPDGQRQLLFRQEDGERMVNQYIRVFRVFAEALGSPSEQAHRKQVLEIHELLLQAVSN